MSTKRAERQMFDKRGFTILEVLIAISLLAIGLLAVATMQITAMRGSRFGNEVTRATFLAEAQLETLRSAAIATLVAGGPYSDANNPVDETGTNGGIFNRSWEITNRTANSRLVTVTVAWNIGGSAHSVALSTITRGGGS